MIKLDHLTVSAGDKTLLKDVCIEMNKGQAVGLTGQSGCGKTTVLKSIMGILGGQCMVVGGDIWLDEQPINQLSSAKRRQLAGTTIGFIPQNPMTAFDSRKRIGKQLLETFCLRLFISKYEAEGLADQVLTALNFPDPQRIKQSFPAELSGGMLQRIAVGILLALKPDYILADEPTSALDEENARNLIAELEKQQSDTGILLVSHDLEAIKQLCSCLYVMEDGRILETNTVDQVLNNPQQEWTKMFVSAYQKPDDGGWQWKEL